MTRLSEDTTRPLLNQTDKEERIDTLLEERIPKYEAVADEIILADHQSFYEIIQKIEQLYKK